MHLDDLKLIEQNGRPLSFLLRYFFKVNSKLKFELSSTHYNNENEIVMLIIHR